MPRYRLFYHLVWTTKYRQPAITERNRMAIHACILAKAAEYDGVVHAINSVADHVHLLLTLPPTVSLAEFVGRAKGASAQLASRLASEATPFCWQGEYSVTTVCERHVEAVVRYVECQAQHHADHALLPDLEPAGNAPHLVRVVVNQALG